MIRNTLPASAKKPDAQTPGVKSSVEPLPQLFTTRAAAKWLGVSESFLTKGRCEGVTGRRTETPVFVKVRGHVWYRLCDLENWLNDLQPRATI
jgi:hypothetical protein